MITRPGLSETLLVSALSLASVAPVLHPYVIVSPWFEVGPSPDEGYPLSVEPEIETQARLAGDVGGLRRIDLEPRVDAVSLRGEQHSVDGLL